MIFVGSRYESADIEYVLDPATGETHPTVFRQHFVPPADSVYIWRSGDRLDILAHAQYGDASLWWRIMDANPALVDPYRIRPGARLRMP